MEDPVAVERRPPIPPGNVKNLVHRLSKDLANAKPPAPAPSALNTSAETPFRRGTKTVAKVRFSYAPKHEDELELKVADVLEVLGEGEEGWLRGKTTTVPGDEHLNSSADDLDHEEEGREIQPKKVKGVGFGVDILSGGVKLRPHSQRFPGDERKDPPPLPAKGTRDASAKEGTRDTNGRALNGAATPKREEFARVGYAYKAQNEDELDLKEGDEIRILSKECEDPGWWLGEIDGRKGVFPDNFVSLIPPKEVGRTAMSPPAVPAKPKTPVSAATAATATALHRQGTPEPARSDKGGESGPPASEAKKWTGPPPLLPSKAPASAAFAAKRDNLSQMFAKRPPSAALSAPSAALSAPSAEPGGSGEGGRGEESEGGGRGLAHLNLGRPKQTGKRPPSKIFLQEMSTSGKEERSGSNRSSLDALEERKTAPAPAKAASTDGDGGRDEEIRRLRSELDKLCRDRDEMSARIRDLCRDRDEQDARIRDFDLRLRALQAQHP